MTYSALGKECTEVPRRKWSSCQQLDKTKKTMSEIDEEKREAYKV